MRFGSVCSGIEAASVAWNPLGWHAAWLAAQAHVPCIAFPERLSGTQCASTENLSPSLGALNPTAIAFTTEQTPKFNSDCALTLTKQSPTGGGQIQSVMAAMQVRRLTPTECERLQGFSDGYTRIPGWKGWRKMGADETPEQCAADGLEVRKNKKTGLWSVRDVDGPRYKALGNSWAVPCISWLGKRIQEVEEVCTNAKRAA